MSWELDVSAAGWAAAGSWMQAFAGFSGAGAVAFAAHKGASTFRTWLKQKQVERHLDVAERLLMIAYKLRSAFDGIRSPGLFANESDAAEAKLSESYAGYDQFEEERKVRLRWGQSILTRLASHAADWDELLGSLPSAKAYFGQEIEQALRVFWGQRANVHTAASMYGGAILNADFKNQLERAIWNGFGVIGDDTVSPALDAAIATLEQRLLPVLRSEVTD